MQQRATGRTRHLGAASVHGTPALLTELLGRRMFSFSVQVG